MNRRDDDGLDVLWIETGCGHGSAATEVAGPAGFPRPRPGWEPRDAVARLRKQRLRQDESCDLIYYVFDAAAHRAALASYRYGGIARVLLEVPDLGRDELPSAGRSQQIACDDTTLAARAFVLSGMKAHIPYQTLLSVGRPKICFGGFSFAKMSHQIIFKRVAKVQPRASLGIVTSCANLFCDGEFATTLDPLLGLFAVDRA